MTLENRQKTNFSGVIFLFWKYKRHIIGNVFRLER